MYKLLAALFLTLAPVAVSATDLSGKWSGSMDLKTPDGQAVSMPVTAEFKQDGKTLTGTVGKASDEQFNVDKGTVEDKKVSFEVQAPDGAYLVKLTIAADNQLEGEVNFTDPGGNPITAKLAYTRDK